MSQQQMKPLMRETASQTAGPYVHIGLAPQQAGFEIFENNFGPLRTIYYGNYTIVLARSST